MSRNFIVFFIVIFFSISNTFFSQSNNYGFENIVLDVTTFRNGDTLFFAQTKEDWDRSNQQSIPAYCYYEGDPNKGILYNYLAIRDPRGIVPIGWKIPNENDFEKLIEKKKLYNFSYSDVINYNISGYRTFDGSDFHSFNDVQYFWTSEEYKSKSFYAKSFIIVLSDHSGRITENRFEDGLSVICIRNYEEQIESIQPKQIVAKDIVCKGQTEILKAIGYDLPSNLKWVWYIGNQRIGEGREINYVFTNDVEVKVRSESQKGTYSDFRSKKIKVDQKPNKPNSIFLTNGNSVENSSNVIYICQGERISMKAIGELKPNETFYWTSNDVEISEKEFLTDEINKNKLYKLYVKNSECGVSDFITKEIKMLSKSEAPDIIELKTSKTKTTLTIGSTAELGSEAKWNWYLQKKNGKQKQLKEGISIDVNSYKSNKYIVKSIGGECPNPYATASYKYIRPATVAGSNSHYAQTKGILHWSWGVGLEGFSLTDSISVIDTTYKFNLNTYGLNYSWSFHPIINEFFTLGVRSNRSLHIGTIGYNNDLANSLNYFSAGNYYLSTRTLVGEMLIGFLKEGKLKLILDYEISRYKTMKIYDDFSSYRIPKKEAVGVGLRIGSYASRVQWDLLYTYSKFDERELYDFNNSIFVNNFIPVNGFKTSLWFHNAIKIDAGIVFDYTSQFKNAMINFGISYSHDRFR